MKAGRKAMLITAILVSGAVIIGSVSADDHHGDLEKCDRGAKHGSHGFERHGDDFMRIDHMTHKLDIDDVQIAAIKALVDESRPRIHELRDAMKSKREQMHQQLEAGFDETAVRSLAESQSSLMTEMIVMRAKLRSDMQAILTPEQQGKMRSFRQRFSDKQSNY